MTDTRRVILALETWRYQYYRHGLTDAEIKQVDRDNEYMRQIYEANGRFTEGYDAAVKWLLEDALTDRAVTAEARVAQLERAIADDPLEANRLRSAIDEALAIIAGGNPDLPAEVLAEVEFRLQEAYNHVSDNRPLPHD